MVRPCTSTSGSATPPRHSPERSTIDAGGFRPFNVASRRCVTSLEGFVQVCAEVSGTTPRIRTVGGGATGEDLPVFNGVDCVFPFSNENTVADLSAADAAGLLEPFLPLHDMIAEALHHLHTEPGRRSWTTHRRRAAGPGADGAREAAG